MDAAWPKACYSAQKLCPKLPEACPPTQKLAVTAAVAVAVPAPVVVAVAVAEIAAETVGAVVVAVTN